MTKLWRLDDDAELRRAAMDWLAARTSDGQETIDRQTLSDFEFRGQRIPLVDPQRGIRKPAHLESALSIVTTYRPDGAARPYEDGLRPDGCITYKWRGTDPFHPENRALRRAMELHQPLIWFMGVGPGLFIPVFPVYLMEENEKDHEFVVTVAETGELSVPIVTDSPYERKYRLQLVKQRVHQPVFAATVMRAYETRCAVCSLRHRELLDAAHIIDDADPGGVASVRNGLALCKIHHAAFDRQILGIRPDYAVEIRFDLLHEIDGPMLRHGLQEHHGQPLMMVPRIKRERPDPEFLDQKYQSFLAATA
ncbi:HNH endonuclease [Janibacter sp. GXQ6167]|uniref:HNH endonuclease n=1 Tax=Janibacter sp. GXQ6167 TaxID=3240791 RepID=UPI003524A07C